MQLGTSAISATQSHVINQKQGWRNVFTSGPATLDHEDYVIKCVGGRQLHECLNTFLPLIL